jgi:predicted metalloprotease with PDZ domain
MLRIPNTPRLTFLPVVALLLVASAQAQQYAVTIRAHTDANDRISVEVTLPPLQQDPSVFVFPVTVPGTYEQHLWWRLVKDFRAFDADGKPLTTSRTADSQFVIPRGTVRLAYRLDDSFDETDKRVNIFHPTGTSFEADSVFVLNHGGITGYVEGLQNRPYTVTVQRSPDIKTFTALRMIERGLGHDVYQANSYDELVDGPAIICIPDTATFNVDGVRVLVAMCGSLPDKPLAAVYAEPLRKATEAIWMFLPRMPVDRYAFLMYLWNGDTMNVKHTKYAQGALEHNFSSLYFWRYNELPGPIEEIAAHEFLHIVVPLNLHSREIEPFDFRSPKMSKHLWLYEGVTEYFAHQSRLRAGHIDEAQFVKTMDGCAKSLRFLPDTFSLTSFSANVLLPENQRLYPVIYQVGPLNALLLDIVIRRETQGRMGVLEMINTLMASYGPSKPFDDNTLFAEIERVTTKEVRAYCEQYMAGTGPLPFKEYLPMIGLEFLDSTRKSMLSFGVEFDASTSGEGGIFIGPGDVNPLGLMKGDKLMKVDGKMVDAESGRMLRRLWRTETTDPITLTVERNGETLELTGPPVETIEVVRNAIRYNPAATADQVAFREQVLLGKSPAGN